MGEHYKSHTNKFNWNTIITPLFIIIAVIVGSCLSYYSNLSLLNNQHKFQLSDKVLDKRISLIDTTTSKLINYEQFMKTNTTNDKKKLTTYTNDLLAVLNEDKLYFGDDSNTVINNFEKTILSSQVISDYNRFESSYKPNKPNQNEITNNKPNSSNISIIYYMYKEKDMDVN